MRLPIFLLIVFLLVAPPVFAGGGPENVLVVVNDESVESLEIARYYMQKRNIPRHHLVHVRIPGGHSFKELGFYQGYKKLLEDPVRKWLEDHPKARITTIVLTRGIPVESYTEKESGPSPIRSTTHMLALLHHVGHGHRSASAMQDHRSNPYHRYDRSIDALDPIEFQGEKFPIYTVSVLNAFSVEDVKRMIDQSVASDAQRPVGKVYLGKSAENDPRGMYSPYFPALQKILKDWGFDAEIIGHATDNVLLKGKKDVIYYQFGQAGWDSNFPSMNRFVPGSVVDNITSVALTRAAFKFPGGGGQTKMSHFLKAGASATHGCVREPTTGAWDRDYAHIKYYLEGYNLIESFFMGHPWFPWMNLVAGDPLMQPFAQRPDVTLVEFSAVKDVKSYKLKVSANATREGAGILKLILYVNGVFQEEVEGDSAEFTLAGFKPKIDEWKVVAVDDSKFRAQGFVRSEALRKDVRRIRASCKVYARGKKAKIRVSGSRRPIFTYVAPGAKKPFGRARTSQLTLVYADAGPHTVEIWIHNAKKGERPYYRFDLPGRKK